jgi:hypothetical protein
MQMQQRGMGANSPFAGFLGVVAVLTISTSVLTAFDSVRPAVKALTAEAIITKSVEANERDWKAATEFSYTETTRDAKGSKTERVIMLFGSPYRRLLEVNGKAISPQARKREKEKFDEAVSLRRSESQQSRSDRISKYERERRRDHQMMEQLTRAFTYELAGGTHMAGHSVYALHATPRPGYEPPDMEMRALTGMKGELWIDQESFQWVKVTAQVIKPVTIGGFLATVERGTYFELEKMPVRGNIWLPKHFRVQSQSRIILFHHATLEDHIYFDYEKTPPQFLSRKGPAGNSR